MVSFFQRSEVTNESDVSKCIFWNETPEKVYKIGLEI